MRVDVWSKNKSSGSSSDLQKQVQKLHESLAEGLQQQAPFTETPLNETQYLEQLSQQLFPDLDEAQRERLQEELNGLGPLKSLLNDPNITEILINSPSDIAFERHGQLFIHQDGFGSPQSYENFLHRISNLTGVHVSLEKPQATGLLGDIRVQMIGTALTQNFTALSLRRPHPQPWNFERLLGMEWCGEEEIQILKRILKEKQNFIVVGSTGSGKTSVLNAFLTEVDSNERVITLEDVRELRKPNTCSLQLFSRPEPQGVLQPVLLSDLVRFSLRLRPDRLVLGEVRGSEAKDLLMALSTGHRGCFGSLHADDPQQALLRLEMLIQQGAPQWSLESVRRLLQLGLDYIVCVRKLSSGERRLAGVYKITSHERHGFLLDALFELHTQ